MTPPPPPPKVSLLWVVSFTRKWWRPLGGLCYTVGNVILLNKFKFRVAGYQTEHGVTFINTRLPRLKPLINVLDFAVSVDVSSIALYSTLLNFIKLLTSKVWSTRALAMEVPTQTIKWRGSPSTCSVRPTFPLVSCKAVEKKRYFKTFHR